MNFRVNYLINGKDGMKTEIIRNVGSAGEAAKMLCSFYPELPIVIVTIERDGGRHDD